MLTKGPASLLLGAASAQAIHPHNAAATNIFGIVPAAAAPRNALPPRAADSTTAAPTPTSTIISFAFPGQQEAPLNIPPTGVSGSIIGIQSSHTTLAYTCASAVQSAQEYYNGSGPGALCPWFTNTPNTIVYGDGYYGYAWSWTYGNDYYSARTTFDDFEHVAAGTIDCAVTATPQAAGMTTGTPAGVVASVDPTCTIDVTSIPAGLGPADVLPSVRCWWEDVAGPQKSLNFREWNSAAFNSCTSSLTATPTTKATGTWKASNVRYWTVTVTEVAAGVTVQPTKSTSAAAIADVGSWGVLIAGLAVAFIL